MKNILAEFGRSIVATIFFALILCGVYPLVVFGAAKLLFPHQAGGSLLVDKSGAVRGSALLAQNFTGAQYFHPRPSAAGASGFDPHISPANAEIQIARVSRARGISEEQLRKIVQENTSGRDLGLFGEPRVNRSEEHT